MAYMKECRLMSEPWCNGSCSKAEAQYVKPHAEYPATEKWNEHQWNAFEHGWKSGFEHRMSVN
jgi:hypothetical protein